jgi:truncated hemoglobin YjbI
LPSALRDGLVLWIASEIPVGIDRRKEFSDAKVTAFVRRYHVYMREDSQLAALFNSCVEDWEAHSARLAAYWGPALRHEPAPDFPALTAVRFGMDADQLERWLELWNRAADEVFTGRAAEEVRSRGQGIAEEHMVGRVAEAG